MPPLLKGDVRAGPRKELLAHAQDDHLAFEMPPSNQILDALFGPPTVGPQLSKATVTDGAGPFAPEPSGGCSKNYVFGRSLTAQPGGATPSAT
jgi:hypothetical protein